MSDPIIIKKVYKKGGGHGSSAWKIALADFMTALMIVFFVLWVKASSEDVVVKGISDHFSGKEVSTAANDETGLSQIEAIYQELSKQDSDDVVQLKFVEDMDVIKAEFKSDSLFQTGSPNLTESANAAIRKFTEAVKDTGVFYHIYGYADNVPVSGGIRFSNNLELSTYRALSVASLMSGLGVDPNAITVHGEGELNPISSNDTSEGRSENRRVEIYVSGSSKPYRPY